MKRVLTAVLLSFAWIAAASAAPADDPTPVVATADAAKLFAGTWRGRVTSGRTLYNGDVELRFLRSGAVIVPPHGTPSRIMWVTLTENGLRGALMPYFDPLRRALVYTIFEARLEDSTLSGVLRERVAMQWTDVASWQVQRAEGAR